MMPEKAEEMLKLYKPYLGRCGYIKGALEALHEEERIMVADHRDDLLNGTAPPPDGMPRGSTVGNPTERVAMMLVTGHVTDDITEIRREIRKLEAEYQEMHFVLLFVEAWISGLPAKERWMIERSYFDGMTYREINAQYRAQFGGDCSKDSLRRLKRDALDKIYEMAK